MKHARLVIAPSLLVALAASCASGADWRADDALAAERLELQVDEAGRAVEYEYHVDPGTVPRNVHEAMDALHPGGKATAAEKEYVGDQLYWELSKEIGGLEVEAMFLPDGTLYSEEVQVAASAIPAAVSAGLASGFGGKVKVWEEIRDGERQRVEYHAKVDKDGKAYKVVLSLAGDVELVVREIQAEIEVPVTTTR